MKTSIVYKKIVTAGFTLIESLFAIFILSTVIVAVMGVASSGSRSAEQSVRSIMAKPLLGESVEALRKIRDTNYLSGDGWLTGIDPECTGVDGCSLDFDISGNPVFTVCSDVCPELTIKSDKYSTDQSGLATGFVRTISVGLVSPTEAQVSVEIIWNDRGKDFALTSQETLRDWAPPSESLSGPESCAVTCTIPGQSGRTIVSFDDWFSYTSGVWDGDYVGISSLNPGYYDIRVQSYDGYDGREATSQSNERWYLEFVDSLQSPVSVTGATTDLDDLVAEACVFEYLETGFFLPETVDEVRPRHQSNISGAADSVYAVCAAFDERGNTPPVITVLGNNPYTVYQGGVFTDPGATAADNEEGDLTGSISLSGSVNTSIAGTYYLTYDVVDEVGATDQAIRTVNVVPVYQCSDGIDNDGDTFTDYPSDIGCTSANDNDETNPPVYQCSDGIDNDGDKAVDYPADPGCTSANDNDETNPK